jgi:nucleoside phosphorylase
MLDELHQPLIQHAEDANIYVLGRVCSLNIVLACLSGMDNKSAAVGAARLRLRNTFPCIQLVITAGTADAITGEEVIRRGDLVVDISGLPRGPVLNAIMAQDTDRPSCLEEIAMAGIKSLPENERQWFERPSADVRLEAVCDCDRWGGMRCQECSSNPVVMQDRRDSDVPFVHYGLVATREEVVNQARPRACIGGTSHALCVETEAVEVLQSLLYLAIGSISNYADSPKNDEWKGYAAMMSAAYVKSVLSTIDSRQDQLGTYSPSVVFFEPQCVGVGPERPRRPIQGLLGGILVCQSHEQCQRSASLARRAGHWDLVIGAHDSPDPVSSRLNRY